MLINERSGQCNVPKTRFNADGFFHPEGDRAGVMNTRGGYFLQEDVRQFENSFFGINNLEATYMDPQQRKLLEVVYECFESAGVSLQQAAGADIGVYVGNFTVDFQTMQARDPEALHRYSATGSGTAILSNRLSYIFDLRGPRYVQPLHAIPTSTDDLTDMTVSHSIRHAHRPSIVSTVQSLRSRRANAKARWWLGRT